jgi:hypothetical protein
MKLYLVGVISALLGAAAIAAAPAAAVTIGQTTPAANYACAAEIDIQSGVASGANFVVPAGSWLLTSWSTFGGFTGGTMSMLILRATSVPGYYTVVAESPVRTLTPGVLNTFAASVPVRGGDFLGFWSGDGAACATFTGSPADVNPYSFGPEPAVGSIVQMSIAPGYLLNISATLTSVADLLANLLADVTGKGPGTSLSDKVQLIQGYVASNDKAAACTALTDFISEVKAQADKLLTASDAASLTAQATTIRATLGC